MYIYILTKIDAHSYVEIVLAAAEVHVAMVPASIGLLCLCASA